MLYRHPSVLFLALISIPFLGSGCGNTPSVVKQVSIQTQGAGDDAVLQLASKLDMNGFSMGSFNLPIYNPTNGAVYGALTTQQLPDGLAGINVSVNVGQLVKLGGTSFQNAKLPNGNAIPLVASSSDVWMLSIGQSSKLYIALLPEQTMVGYALTIPQFDSISQVIPFALNFFPVIPIQSDLNVAGGIFTGAAASTSGVALFADYEHGVVINPMKKMKSSSSAKIQLASANTSDSNKVKLAKALKKVRNNQPHLRIQ